MRVQAISELHAAPVRATGQLCRAETGGARLADGKPAIVQSVCDLFSEPETGGISWNDESFQHGQSRHGAVLQH